MGALDAVSLYNIFYGMDMPYVGFLNILKNFFTRGDNYVYWLGAAWFILVLFWVTILHKLLVKMCGENVGFIYTIVSVTLFASGYYCVSHKILQKGMFDLALIAQGYFATGQIIKERKVIEKIQNKKFLIVSLTVVCLLYILTAGKITDITVDYPSRKFGNIFINYLSGIAGSFVLYGMAKLLLKLKEGRIRSYIGLIGKNTIGILLFHFLAFKIIFLCFAALKIIPYSDVQLTTPSNTLQKYWIFITAGAILMSLAFWRLLQRLSGLRILFGEKKFWETVWDKATCTLNLSQYVCKGKKKCRYAKVFLPLLLCVILWGGMICSHIKETRPQIITFPSKEQAFIQFGEGWLPQGEEPYRWINKKGILTVERGKWDQILISGYVPDNYTEVTSVSVLIDKEKIYEKDLVDEKNWDCKIECDQDWKMGETQEIEICFDGVHMPDENDVDLREMSGLVSKIEFADIK